MLVAFVVVFFLRKRTSVVHCCGLRFAFMIFFFLNESLLRVRTEVIAIIH